MLVDSLVRQRLLELAKHDVRTRFEHCQRFAATKEEHHEHA